jgi:plastocyanin
LCQLAVTVPKLARNSVGGLGVGVKSWGLGLFAAIFEVTLLLPAFAGADPSGQNSDATAPPISADILGPDATIKMSDDTPMYQPEIVTIRAGQTIEWKNAGTVSHSVTDDAKRATRPDDALVPKNAKPFNSGNVMPGRTFRHTFTVPGRYRYFCLSHEVDKMVGEVIVQEVPGSPRSRVSSAAREKPKVAKTSARVGSAPDEAQPWRYLDRDSDVRDDP